MKAKVIDGQKMARALLSEVAMEVAALQAGYGMVPSLASLRVGDNPGSRAFGRSEARASREVGIGYLETNLPQVKDSEEVVRVIREIDADLQVHGIIVPLPLPRHLHSQMILEAVDPQKDVDGLHPINIGRLSAKDGEPLFIPSTALAVMFLLEEIGVRMEGARAVVVGRSDTAGLPIAHLFMRRNATVTICHSRTVDLGKLTSQADILVMAAGKPEMIRGEMVKPGSVVIDVGINQIPDQKSKTGYRVVGDVAFEEVAEIAAAITPVPGGVGPVTIAMLLRNTLVAAVRQGKGAGTLPLDYKPRIKI